MTIDLRYVTTDLVIVYTSACVFHTVSMERSVYKVGGGDRNEGGKLWIIMEWKK